MKDQDKNVKCENGSIFFLGLEKYQVVSTCSILRHRLYLQNVKTYKPDRKKKLVMYRNFFSRLWKLSAIVAFWEKCF